MISSEKGDRRPHRSRFRAGELVRIRSADEIVRTLDEHGTLDGLPFMPEMVRFCGTTVRVRSSAHKTCDGANLSGGLRQMDAAVHLEGLHCDGQAHGGCQARCPLYWKDAWLEPAAAGPGVAESDAPTRELAGKAAASVLVRGRDPAEGTYSCQATEVQQATSPLPFYSPRQYWDDVRSGNVTVRVLLRNVPVLLFNKFQLLSTRALPERLRIRGGQTYPWITGPLAETPDVRLGIEPGENVEVRSHAEILETLDTQGRNRGLGFDGDMVPYCGRRAPVRHRVETRIDERTGELVRLRNPCLVLDGVVCQGIYHRFCPRGVDPYWREVWLRRLDEGPR